MTRLLCNNEWGEFSIDEDTSELTIDEMCEMFQRLLLAMGYQFKDGYNIMCVPEDCGYEDTKEEEA